MKARLVKIGNSRGIRLPKAVIEQAGIDEEVELEVHDNQIIISTSRNPREGWDEACRLMAERGDDALLDGPLPSLTKFDEEEWEW
jgi:antitoxin MazE